MSFQTLDAIATRTAVARVNLLPPEIGEARAFKRLQLGLAAGFATVLGLAGVAVVVTFGHVGDAQEALDAEAARTPGLQAQQVQYADVPTVLAEVETAARLQQEATAYDIAWYGYLNALSSKAPKDLSLQTLTFTVTPPVLDAAAPAPAAGAAPAAVAAVPGTDPLAVPGIGTVSVTGQTKSQNLVAGWMEALGSIDGLARPTLSTSTLEEQTGVITFTTSATVTDAALLAKQ